MINTFGGPWTEQKLKVLNNYLNFFMTALKNRSFKKVYIDCFAGSGAIKFSSNKEIIGSTRIALDLEIKFDEYYFIEKDMYNYEQLLKLKDEYPHLNIKVYNGDCNEILPTILNNINWIKTRGILFIDPYATELKFETLEKIARTKAIDVWYLFPYNAVTRLLPKDKCNNNYEKTLNSCFGEKDWQEKLYKPKQQLNLFGTEEYERVPMKDVQKYIFQRMKSIFPYVSEDYLCLKNTKNSTLFLLFLLISNDSPNTIGLVKKVEKYILKKESMI